MSYRKKRLTEVSKLVRISAIARFRAYNIVRRHRWIMAITKFREVLLHPISVTEALESDIAATAPTIRVSGVVSPKLRPRSLSSALICIDSKEAKRIEKLIASAKKAKKKIGTLRILLEDAEDSRQELESEKRILEIRIVELEGYSHKLEHNLETLAKNLDDRELLIQSARSGSSKCASGHAKLVDRGAVGLPLQGGLPSLGKNSK